MQARRNIRGGTCRKIKGGTFMLLQQNNKPLIDERNAWKGEKRGTFSSE